jgi:hypothetical protein
MYHLEVEMFNISISGKPEMIAFVRKSELNMWMIVIASGFFSWGNLFNGWANGCH